MAIQSIPEEALVPGEAMTLATEPVDSGVFPPFDTTTFTSQLFWFAIAFALFYYLMAKVALPRLGGILEDRRDRIASDLDLAEKLKQESDAAIAAYEKALADARTSANVIAEEARETAKQAAVAQRAATEAELATQLASAEARIGEIKSKALSEVGAIASETADAIVRKLVEADVTKPEVDEAVSAALASR